MPLISPDEFKKSKGKEKGNQPSKGGLISPSEFKAKKVETKKTEEKKVEEKKPSNIVNRARANTIMEPIDFQGAVERLPKTDPFVNSFQQSANRLAEENKKVVKLGGMEFPVTDYSNDPSRKIPVVGPILKALDKVKEFTLPVAQVGGAVYTPGGGLANTATMVGNVGSKLATKAPIFGKTVEGLKGGSTTVRNTLSNRVANEAIKEGVTGVPLAMGQSLAQGQDLDEVAKQGAIGGVGGAVLGGALPLVGKGVSKVLDKYKNSKVVVDDVPNDVFPDPVKVDAVKQGWNERLFGNQVMGITPQSLTTTRNKLSTEGQIVDKPLKQSIEGVVESTKAAGRSAYQNLVDNLDPIKKISKEAYDASIDANRANQISNVIVTDKFVTPQGDVVGEGLQGIVRKAGRGNYNAFTD